jgi:predicted RNase H-like nuclease
VRAVGVDGCKGGWVAVAVDDGGACSAHLLGTIDAITRAVPDAAVIAIDIPIGLVERGQRQADLAVRRLLGARRNSVFMTPVRLALEAASHAEGSSLSVASGGPGISRQAYGLRQRIFEVERWLSSAPCPVREAHPELCFAEMRGGRPPSASKKTWQGMIERRAALAAVGMLLDDIDPAVGSMVPVDDLLDAAAAAWTAKRLLAGVARSIPDPPEDDRAGGGIAIWV